jgi:1-acyl-sn-glycerol-3-phosphate acyltransferase
MGRIVYAAPLQMSWGQWALAVVTLRALFSLAQFYAPIAILVVVYFATRATLMGVVVVVGVVLSTLWPTTGPWLAFGEGAVFSAWRSYFSLRVIRDGPVYNHSGDGETSATHPPPPPLLCFLPHGLFPMALPLLSPTVCTVVFPELNGRTPRTAIADSMFWTPVISPMLTWLGCVSAHKESITKTMLAGPNGTACVIVPDGIAGVYATSQQQQQQQQGEEEDVVYLDRRKGFVSIAVQVGAPLVPIYCFGHTQIFNVLYPRSPDSWLARLSRRLGFSLVAFLGPRRVPLTVVVGAPIYTVKEGGPAEVDRAHAEFKRSVSDLYKRYGNGNELKII